MSEVPRLVKEIDEIARHAALAHLGFGRRVVLRLMPGDHPRLHIERGFVLVAAEFLGDLAEALALALS